MGKVGFVAAAAAPFGGLGRVLRDARMRRQFLAGLVIAILVMLAVFGGGMWGTFTLVDRGLGSDGGFWTDALSVFLKIAATGLLIVALPVLFTLLFGIVGGAFLTAVHERARALAGGADYPARGVGAEAVVTARSVVWALRRLLNFLVLSVLVALFALIPVVGVAAVVLEVIVAARALTWELLTPHFEARRLGYREQRRFLRQRPLFTLGLGGAGTLLLLIPFAQPLVIFGNQAGAGALSAMFDPD